MKWPWAKKQPTEDDKTTLDQARSMREHAQQKLNEARVAAREVTKVTIEARRIRRENQFSQRLAEAFGRPHNHG